MSVLRGKYRYRYWYPWPVASATQVKVPSPYRCYRVEGRPLPIPTYLVRYSESFRWGLPTATFLQLLTLCLQEWGNMFDADLSAQTILLLGVSGQVANHQRASEWCLAGRTRVDTHKPSKDQGTTTSNSGRRRHLLPLAATHLEGSMGPVHGLYTWSSSTVL